MILWNLIMINKLYLYLVVCLFFIFNSSAEESYQPNWNSLANHNEAPEWFRNAKFGICLLYTSPSPRDNTTSRMPSSA